MPPPTIAPEMIDRALEGIAPEMVAFRRDIHAHPELAWNEMRTSAAVADRLRRCGLAPTLLPTGTGLVCDIPASPAAAGTAPRVALRADLDALPIEDEKDTPYRSTTPGVAHACGHDVHTAVVLGVGVGLARLAAAGELPGPVRLLFQPAEEVIPGGALALLDRGALKGVERVFALHCDPRVDAGSVAVRPGPMTGATDSVTVRLSGPGGHTARPQLTVDVVAALADVVVRTPALLSRRIDPRAGMSLVWGQVAAGSAANVIPQSGEAAGTIRALDLDAWRSAPDVVPEIIREIAAPYGAHVEVDYTPGVPPAINDPGATAAFSAVVGALLGADRLLDSPQSMGAEDFAWILDRVPGVLARLGVRPPGTTDAPDIHRGDFDVDETAITCGTRTLLAATLDALGTPGPA